MAEPLRTCALTRQRHPRSALVRCVVDEAGRVRVDPDATAPGRGAWLLARAEVLTQVQTRPSLLGKALRRKGLAAGDLLEEARQATLAGILDALATCRRSGLLVSGARALAQAGPLDAVILARGCRRPPVAPGTLVVELPLTSAELGRLLGRGPRAAIGARPARPARRLSQWLRRGRSLGYPTA